MHRKLFVSILAFLVLAGLGTAPPSQASSAGPAYLMQNIYLASSPPVGSEPATMSRAIYLDADIYRWEIIVDDYPMAVSYGWSYYVPIQASRDIYLAAGWYTWTCTLTPGSYYYETCGLSGPYGSAYLSSSPAPIPYDATYRRLGILTPIS